MTGFTFFPSISITAQPSSLLLPVVFRASLLADDVVALDVGAAASQGLIRAGGVEVAVGGRVQGVGVVEGEPLAEGIQIASSVRGKYEYCNILNAIFRDMSM